MRLQPEEGVVEPGCHLDVQAALLIAGVDLGAQDVQNRLVDRFVGVGADGVPLFHRFEQVHDAVLPVASDPGIGSDYRFGIGSAA